MKNFGEVAHAVVSPSGDWATVAFYDVRHAQAALKALGAFGCIAGPQAGSRWVELAGNAELNIKDCAGISKLSRSEERDNAFTIEFFDIRDAQSCRDAQKAYLVAPPGLGQEAKLAQQQPTVRAKASKAQKSAQQKKATVPTPPGLPLPPGLFGLEEKEVGSSSSTSATWTAGDEESWQVLITGLPNKLLAKAMLEAMLQQAGLHEMYSGLTIQHSRSMSQVSVCFTNPAAAQRCALHFQGCRWDKSGPPVAANVIPPGSFMNSLPAPKKKVTLSAQAPEFVPVPVSVSGSSGATADPKLKSGSDTSTDVGESEDEKSLSPFSSTFVTA